MKILELNIFTEAELRDRPVYVFRRVDRTGQSRYAFVKHDGPKTTLTFSPTGEANLLFYTSRDAAETSLQKINDPSIKLSIIPISQIRYLERKTIKKPDDTGYALYLKSPQGDSDFGYQAIMPNGSYQYVVGKSRKAQRNRLLKFDSPKDASYFARRYFRDNEVQIRPVSPG
jgi:hypothetical protein